MTLAIDWPHDPGENGSATLRGGPMTLAIGWPHEGGENASRWPHQPGDWQPESGCSQDPAHVCCFFGDAFFSPPVPGSKRIGKPREELTRRVYIRRALKT